MEQIAALLKENLVFMMAVGSRVTCTPPPIDTDDDRLLLVKNYGDAEGALISDGWHLGGSAIPADQNCTAPDEFFASFTKGEINLIVTPSEEFARRFVAATSVAQRLNLTQKDDRIALFQAVLYGRGDIENDNNLFGL